MAYRKLQWLICSAALLVGCSEREVKIDRMQPAQVFLRGVDTLAVKAFDGQHGADLANRVAHELAQRDFYKVVDRSRPQDYLDERSLTGDANAQAKMISADATLSGAVAAFTYAEDVDHSETPGDEGKIDHLFVRSASFNL